MPARPVAIVPVERAPRMRNRRLARRLGGPLAGRVTGRARGRLWPLARPQPARA